MFAQQLVHKAITAANSLQQAFGSAVEELSIVPRDGTVEAEDEAKSEVLNASHAIQNPTAIACTVFKESVSSCKNNHISTQRGVVHNAKTRVFLPDCQIP